MVHSASIRGSINPGAAAYLEQVIDLAGKDPAASAVLVELNTPGGLLASTREMVQAISRSKVPVLFYVGPSGASATSAGAILLVASHAAGMSPGTNVGAAHPVGSSGEDISGTMKEKATNDTVALIRSLAEERGRPTAIAEDMVRNSRSLTAQDAFKEHVVQVVADTREAFLDAVDGREVKVEESHKVVKLRTRGARIQAHEMSLGQRLLHFLADPNVATLLMSLGGLLIYVEVANPGITIAGVLGGICLITGFMSFQLLPIRTGGLLLFVLGVVMLIIEAITPAHGALAVGGILSLVLGILWVMDPAGGTLHIDPSVWIPVVASLAGLVAIMTLAAARTRRLLEQTLRTMKGGAQSGLQGYVGEVEWVDPADRSVGRILIRGEVWTARCDSGALRTGEKVEVVAVDGLTVRVKEIENV